MAQVLVVTGASRGIGLEFTRQLLAHVPRVRVVAAARRPSASAELLALQAQHGPQWLTVVQLDLANQDSIHAAAREVAQACPNGIDTLINNAGTLGSYDLASETTSEDLEAVLRVNVIGTLAMTRALLPLLRVGRRKTVVNLSSGAGSIAARGGQGGWGMRSLAYKASKAAINMATVLLARELQPEGFIVVPITPGWVATDLGIGTADFLGPGAPRPSLDAASSVRGMLDVIHGLGPDDSGIFFNYDGKRLEW